MDLFSGIGILLGLYLLVSLLRGQVYVKRGPWGETVYRAQQPGRYWLSMAIYAALAVALLTVF